MSVRPEVLAFLALGPLPSSEDADEASLRQHQLLLERILPPVTSEESVLLAKAFGPDECFGIAWSLVHLIETAPRPTERGQLEAGANPWLALLWERQQRAADEA